VAAAVVVDTAAVAGVAAAVGADTAVAAVAVAAVVADVAAVVAGPAGNPSQQVKKARGLAGLFFALEREAGREPRPFHPMPERR
jgi:hypothetical protein